MVEYDLWKCPQEVEFLELLESGIQESSANLLLHFVVSVE